MVEADGGIGMFEGTRAECQAISSIRRMPMILKDSGDVCIFFRDESGLPYELKVGTVTWADIADKPDDALIRVYSFTNTAVPTSPEDGQTHYIPAGSQAPWDTKAGQIAKWSSDDSAWSYYTPAVYTTLMDRVGTYARTFQGGLTSYLDAIGAMAFNLRGAAGGVASLDETGKVPAAQMASYVDDIVEYPNQAAFPAVGESGKIYVDISTTPAPCFRWSGSVYSPVGSSLALGENSSTAYRGDRGKTAYDHSQVIGNNPHNTTAQQVGALPVSDPEFTGMLQGPNIKATALAGSTQRPAVILNDGQVSQKSVEEFRTLIESDAEAGAVRLKYVSSQSKRITGTNDPSTMIPDSGRGTLDFADSWWQGRVNTKVRGKVLFTAALLSSGNVIHLTYGGVVVGVASYFSGASGTWEVNFELALRSEGTAGTFVGSVRATNGLGYPSYDPVTVATMNTYNSNQLDLLFLPGSTMQDITIHSVEVEILG